MILRGEVDPHQLGAFLMLLRFRGEDADEIAGMVDAARESFGLSDAGRSADLDWPSYGAGRTRGAPWYLLSALALSHAGIRVLMHGSNVGSSGIAVESALAALPPGALSERFTYKPLAAMSPALDRLLRLRALFGLRSPVNTILRLLNPGNAPAGVDGVFHPHYIDVHLGVAERTGRERLLVLKGGGGEAERVPLKPGTAWLWDRATGRSEISLSAETGLPPLTPKDDTVDDCIAVWSGAITPPTVIATIIATIALGLTALNRADDPAAIWTNRPVR